MHPIPSGSATSSERDGCAGWASQTASQEAQWLQRLMAWVTSERYGEERT